MAKEMNFGEAIAFMRRHEGESIHLVGDGVKVMWKDGKLRWEDAQPIHVTKQIVDGKYVVETDAERVKREHQIYKDCLESIADGEWHSVEEGRKIARTGLAIAKD